MEGGYVFIDASGNEPVSLELDTGKKPTGRSRPAPEAVGNIPVAENTLYYPAIGRAKVVPIRLTPYFAFAYRGTSDMLVWLLYK